MRSSTTFVKGHKHSPESILKQSIAMKGRVSTFKGMKHSPEAKIKMGLTKKGKPLSYEHRMNVSNSLKGRKLSEDHVRKVTLANKGKVRPNIQGENHPCWIKDRTKLKQYFRDERRSSIYKTWRHDVCTRDNWKCKIANSDCSGRLEVHHILGFKEYPELRYVINNGITLCKHHHPRKAKDVEELSPFFQQLVLNKIIT